MMGHKICFEGEIWIIIPKLSLLPLLIWSTGVNFSHMVSEVFSHDMARIHFQSVETAATEKYSILVESVFLQ